MEHEELLETGTDDFIDGNESYACRYLRGVMYAAGDGISIGDINGSEGLMSSIWEKIKQFCSWFAGLFSGKKDTGVATKEIGLKPIQKVPTEKIKVTPVVASKVEKEKPAPKAHVPTEAQKQPISKPIPVAVVHDPAHPEKVEEVKPVQMVVVPHDLGKLQQRLIRIYNDIKDGVFTNTNKMGAIANIKLRTDATVGANASIWSKFNFISADDYEKIWNPVVERLEAFNKKEVFHNFTESDVNRLGETTIPDIIKAIEAAKNKTFLAKNFNLEQVGSSKDALANLFKSELNSISEEHQAEVMKILVRVYGCDYVTYFMTEQCDALSFVKRDIGWGNYFVRAPKG